MNFANLASFQGIEFADLSFCVDLPRLACAFASEMNVQGSVYGMIVSKAFLTKHTIL